MTPRPTTEPEAAPPDAPLVLVVEDEPALREMVLYNLAAEGWRAAGAASGDEGLTLIDELGPDLVILDWMLPGVSGLEICRRLRRRPATAALPIILLTARGEEEDRVRGLETGADDYVVKPFSVRELMARVRAALRRARPAAAGEVLEHGPLRLEGEARRVLCAGRELRLGPTEFRLLAALMERPGRVWTRDALLDRVWGRESLIDGRTVDVHIGRLRRALERAGADPALIRTIRGAGYALGEPG
ncbi:MAG: phosphate regulon transcriptional regulatory protein PhoB [Alphaproteobacteria bacterium]|nr:MAG: phosphate regulon transcriptional regulatory protein PhoB [Alphaproteobacteria bacterium]